MIDHLCVSRTLCIGGPTQMLRLSVIAQSDGPTDRTLIFGERHLRRVLAEYATPYNTQRPHRALHLRPPRPQSPVPEPVLGRIRRRPVLGGLINQYESAA